MQDQTGYYDYGFRQMDAQLGRWHVIDAMAENYMSTSPYAYVMNNPISHIDVMGLYRGGGTQWRSYPKPYLDSNSSRNGGGMFYQNNMPGSLMGLNHHTYNNLIPNHYDWWTGTYRNSKGEKVSYDEAFNSSVATNGTTYVGTDLQNLITSIISGLTISLVDFNGDLRLVASTEALVAGYFNITGDGIEYSGDGYTAVYLGEGASISEYKNSWLSRTFDYVAGGIEEFWGEIGRNQESKHSTGHPDQTEIGGIMSNAAIRQNSINPSLGVAFIPKAVDGLLDFKEGMEDITNSLIFDDPAWNPIEDTIIQYIGHTHGLTIDTISRNTSEYWFWKNH